MVKVVAVFLGLICAVSAVLDNDKAVSARFEDNDIELTTAFEAEGRKYKRYY